MKKTITCLMGILVAVSTHAQITLTRADFGVFDDKVYYAYDTTVSTSFNVDLTGSGITWNISPSAIQPDYYDSAVFMNPASFPQSPEEANMAIMEGGEAGYFNISEDFVKIIIPLEALGVGNPVLKIAAFPMNYGDVIKDSAAAYVAGTPADFGFSGLPFDSIRVNIDIHTESVVQGWGTLAIADSNYASLKVKNTTLIDATIEGKIPFIGTWTEIPGIDFDETQQVYAWYANNKKFTIAEAGLDTLGNVEYFRYQVAALPGSPNTGLRKVSTNITSAIQPNPANEELRIRFTSTHAEKATVLVLDITGKTVYTEQVKLQKDQNELTIPTSELNNGIYFVRIVSEHVQSNTKFVVKH